MVAPKKKKQRKPKTPAVEASTEAVINGGGAAAPAVKAVVKKVKKEKKKPDHGIPRPLSGFFNFCTDNRVQVRAENPGGSAPEVARALGAMWKTLNDETKKKYNDAAAEASVKYKAAVAAATAAAPPA